MSTTGEPCTAPEQSYLDAALTDLYYKSDTAADSRPTSSGGSSAQTNNTNTGPASQNLDPELHYKGPNDYYDLTRFGLYTANGGAITCSTRAGSAVVNCPNGIGDFAVGQGIEIPRAGATPTFDPWGVTHIRNYARSSNVATYSYLNTTFGAGQAITITGLADSSFNGKFTVTANTGDFYTFTVPNSGSNLGTTAGTGTATLTSPTVVVTPGGTLNGSTTYAYKIVMRGYHGELSVASPAGTTTTGAATLGVNTVSISSCARVSGLTTCTTSSAHNFQNNVLVNILGESDPSLNGSFTIAGVSSTTFTFYQNGAPDTSATSGTASVVAKNTVQWNMQQYTVLQSIIYRSKNGGAYSIAGVTEGMDSAFVDWGLGAPIVPAYIPTTPPSGTTNGILATTITGIRGITLTLAAKAANTATNQSSQHDNVPIVLAGCAAMPRTAGGTLLIPALNPATTIGIQFNSPLDFYHNCNVSQLTLETGSPILANDPIIVKKSGLTIKGRPGDAVNGSIFPALSTTRIVGNAYPFIYFIPGTFGPSTIENFQMQCFHPYQSCVLQDQDAGGGGVASITYNNDYFSGVAGSMPFLMRSGGFDFYFNGGSFQVDSGSWGVPEALTITCNHGLGMTGGQFGQTIATIMEFHNTHFAGQGILYEAYGFQPLPNTPGHITMFEPLIENAYGAFLRYDVPSNPVINTTIYNLGYSDPLAGQATPLIDVTNVSGLSTFKTVNASCSAGYQPLFEGGIGGGVEVSNGFSGCGTIGLPTYALHSLGGTAPIDSFVNGMVQVSGASGAVFATMGLPAAPTAAVTTGGSVPLGAHTYSITSVDVNGGETLVGPGVSATATSGNQTITITPPTLPAGAVGWRVYRDGLSAVYPGCSLHPPSFIASSSTFVDTFGFLCGLETPSINTAGVSTLTPTTVSGPTLKVVGGGFVDTLSGNFTANRTHILPDVTGTISVSSYLNSSYDNFKRANSAIGASWTVTDGGFNVASNALLGTARVNLAYWSANIFSNAQFAQVAVASLNGTTDFVGVQVLMSPSGNGYTCVENSTTLLLQKMSAFAGANLTTSTSAGAVGDILRLEVTSAGVLTCSRNAGGAITSITATDTTYTSGSPGLEQFGNVATMDDWSGGNLHPIAQMDIEQDWTKTQHFTQGVAIASEALSASPRAEQNIFLPSALTSTWTASTWTTDKAITVTRVQAQAKTPPAGCSTNAVVRLTDGTTPVNVTIASSANDSGSISQNYAAGTALQLVVQTAAAGCKTSPADANVVVQYRMQ